VCYICRVGELSGEYLGSKEYCFFLSGDEGRNLRGRNAPETLRDRKEKESNRLFSLNDRRNECEDQKREDFTAA
jgi:hypothetical protein